MTITKVTKHAAMPACFVTNEVVTNRAGIAPFFHLDISTSVIVLCVCVRAHARACVKERQRRKERKSQRERESDSERENECVRHIFHTAHRATGSSSHVVYNIDYVDTHTHYNNRCTDIQVLYAQSNTEFQFSAD